jgi:hypothetical protein
MKRALILAGGWIVTVIGLILTPIPMPLPFPFPIGITMFLVGCAILTTHSKTFRRAIQYVRHHNAWLCRGLDAIALRAPQISDALAQRLARSEGAVARWFRGFLASTVAIVTGMIDKTRPTAHGRKARMRDRHI